MQSADRFFSPFSGGIFFDNQLCNSPRLTFPVMCMPATGSHFLPAPGIGALPLQLAARLPADSARLGVLCRSCRLGTCPVLSKSNRIIAKLLCRRRN